MNTENTLCKAEIKPNSKIFTLICSLILGICVVIFILTMITFETTCDSGGNYRSRNIFGHIVAMKGERADYWIDKRFFGNTVDSEQSVLLIVIGLSFIILVVVKLMCWGAERSRLSLTVDGINGMKKDLFSSKVLDIPFENITSISVQKGILDKLIGGETVAVASATGFIKFRGIQNANEFVNMTLEELKKYKESVSNKSAQQTVVNNSSDEADKLMKLKKLLEQGLITQEEFEQKRQELISRM